MSRETGSETDSPGKSGVPSLESLAPVYLKRVYGLCRAFFRDPWEAEDACQETFLAVARNRHRLAEVREIAPWISKVTLRTCLWMRRRRRRRSALLLDPDVEGPKETPPPIEAAEDPGKIRDAIERLPDRYRVVLALKYQQGLGHEEIAESLGLSSGAMRVLLHRAIARLRAEVRVP